MSLSKEVLDRYHLKTSEGEFMYELLNSYELSHKVSEQIIQTAKHCLLRDKSIQTGQIEYYAVGLDEKSGKPLDKMQISKILLTLKRDKEDLDCLSTFGSVCLRQIRIQRLTEEALEQKSILSQEDLSIILNVDVRTIKRDIQELRNKEIAIITRGVFHNIGRGQTHKVKIINLYLDSFTFSEIKRKTQHSIGAIKRYLDSFGKILMCYEYKVNDIDEISSVTGYSRYLIEQYTEIIELAKKNPQKKQNLEILQQQLSYQYGSKKTITNDGLKVEATIGGYK